MAGIEKAALAAVLCFSAVLQACSGKQGPASFDSIFEKLSRANGYNQAMRYYTDDTADAVDEAVSLGVISGKNRGSVLPRFDEKTKWEELSKSADGPRGMIRIRYTEHPAQNMIGFAMDFKLKKEKGTWKIDLADDIRAALRLHRGRNAADYIKRVKNKY